MWGLDAPLEATHNHHGPVLILAFFAATEDLDEYAHALFVCDDGRIRSCSVNELTADWRLNWTTHTWEDTNLGDINDQGDYGGPQVPGDIPEPDSSDPGDPSDEGDGAVGGVDSK